MCTGNRKHYSQIWSFFKILVTITHLMINILFRVCLFMLWDYEFVLLIRMCDSNSHWFGNIALNLIIVMVMVNGTFSCYIGYLYGQDPWCEKAAGSERRDMSFDQLLLIARGNPFPSGRHWAPAQFTMFLHLHWLWFVIVICDLWFVRF